MTLTLKDLERMQTALQESHQDYQLELVEGRISVMGPCDITSSEIGARLSYFLNVWVIPRKMGRVYDSSGGFILPSISLMLDFTCSRCIICQGRKAQTQSKKFCAASPGLDGRD